MITMTEIAKLTGVSQATVSRVLNGNTAVNAEVTKKVLECAKQHDYQPNIIAQSLVGNKTFLLGVIVTDISNPFFADLVKVIEAEASAKGYTLMLFNTDYDAKKERKYLEILRRYRADGVLIVPTRNLEFDHENAKKNTIPMVSVTMNLKSMDSVFVSHYDAGVKVAKHLLGMGMESFLFIGGQGDDKEAGFLEALEEAEIDTEKHYQAIYGDVTSKLMPILKKRLEEEKVFGGVAIFANNDITALKILQYLKELNVQIPQDVALVGFDNTYVCKLVSPTITSVAQPVDELGRLAVERIIELIEKKSVEERVSYQLDTRLVARESTVKLKKVTVKQ